MSLLARRLSVGSPFDSGSPFDPLSIGWHTAFWADDPNWTDPGDGNNVSQWDDASGNGRHATQPTASDQPTYVDADVNLGGQPSVQFFSGDRLHTSAFSSALTQPGTIVVVVRFAELAGIDNQKIVTGLSSGNRWIVWDPGSGTSNHWSIYAGTTQRANVSADTNAHLLVATFDSTDTLELDGTEIISADAGSGSLDGLTLGARFDGAAHYIEQGGGIGFVGLLDGTLTAQQKSDLLAWSQSYYDL